MAEDKLTIGAPPKIELTNQSARAQVRASLQSKLNLFWGDRELGFALVVFDPKSGELITDTNGDVGHITHAIEKFNRHLQRMKKGSQIVVPGRSKGVPSA